MNTNASRFARYIALPIVSAGIIGGAALGLAGAANAATTDVRPPSIRTCSRATPADPPKTETLPAAPGRVSHFSAIHRLGDTGFHPFNRRSPDRLRRRDARGLSQRRRDRQENRKSHHHRRIQK